MTIREYRISGEVLRLEERIDSMFYAIEILSRKYEYLNRKIQELESRLSRLESE